MSHDEEELPWDADLAVNVTWCEMGFHTIVREAEPEAGVVIDDGDRV